MSGTPVVTGSVSDALPVTSAAENTEIRHKPKLQVPNLIRCKNMKVYHSKRVGILNKC